jgi:hypothetical protein
MYNEHNIHTNRFKNMPRYNAYNTFKNTTEELLAAGISQCV